METIFKSITGQGDEEKIETPLDCDAVIIEKDGDKFEFSIREIKNRDGGIIMTAIQIKKTGLISSHLNITPFVSNTILIN